MSENRLVVREMNNEDLELFVEYWLSATPEFLFQMGVDVAKRPNRTKLVQLVSSQFQVSLESRKNYFLTWLINGKPVGCSNINQIEYGKRAFMHLHLWKTEYRQKGQGTAFIKKSLPFYFNNFDLKFLFCEPYALNPAPNRTVEKIGFQLVKSYQTISGASNFKQLVNQWKFTRANFEQAYNL